MINEIYRYHLKKLIVTTSKTSKIHRTKTNRRIRCNFACIFPFYTKLYNIWTGNIVVRPTRNIGKQLRWSTTLNLYQLTTFLINRILLSSADTDRRHSETRNSCSDVTLNYTWTALHLYKRILNRQEGSTDSGVSEHTLRQEFNTTFHFRTSG